jgi:catechol 2,3-dioxygenase-like lactoylglutathione lyase family enzyme
MFSHMTLGVTDMDRATAFYDAVLAPLGRERFFTFDAGAGYGAPQSEQVWLMAPFDGNPPTAGNGSMVAFMASNRQSVRDAYNAALEHGGSDEGAPGLRPHYHDNYYGAYLRDPDGNKICVVCHTPE